MIRALVVDDDPANRAYLRTLLVAHPEVTIIDEAEAISTAQAMIAAEAPDLLFLDVEMPGGSASNFWSNWAHGLSRSSSAPAFSATRSRPSASAHWITY